MADWRTSTLNSNLSTTQRLINRSFAPQAHTSTGRPIPNKPSPLLAEDRDISDRPNSNSGEEHRSETQSALLQETLTALKDEAKRLDDDIGELLSHSPEWADVEPWECPPEGHAAVDIQYTPEYADAFGLLYAVIQSGEKSSRVLQLTEKCIMLCPSHYTAWHWRFLTLKETGADMDDEWTLCRAVTHHSAKNYQVWHYRRLLAMEMGEENARREIEFASACLEEDEKNYHVWSHRQWSWRNQPGDGGGSGHPPEWGLPLPQWHREAVVKRFGLWKAEWEYTEQMLIKDCHNNSAWTQRAWILAACITCRIKRNLIAHTGGDSDAEDVVLDDADDTQPRFMPGTILSWVKEELAYVRMHCERTPHNESPWNYLNGLHYIVQDATAAAGREVEGGSVLAELPAAQQADLQSSVRMIAAEAFSICQDVAVASPACVPARAALFKQHLHMARASQAAAGTWKHAAKTKHALQGLRDALIKMDPIRGNWYRHAVGELYADGVSEEAS